MDSQADGASCGPTRPGPFSRYGKYLLALGSALITLLLAELAVRLFFSEEVDTEVLRRLNQQAVFGDITRPSRHPELTYELALGKDIQWFGTRVVIHPREYRRIAPEPAEEPADAIKIALLGDSTPFGWRVEYSDTYGEVLRQMLEQHLDRPVALHNYSVPGYNSHYMRITYRDRVRAWKPDLVILHHDHNDADPIQSKPHGYMEPEFGDNPLGSAVIKFAVRRLYHAKVSHLREAEPVVGRGRESFYHHYRYAGAEYDRHLDERRGLAALLREDGCPAVVLIFNTWLTRQDHPEADPFYTRLHQPLVSRLLAMGFMVVDMYGPAQRLMQEQGWSNLSPTWVGRHDGHPGPRGHAFLARLLFDAITTQPGRIPFVGTDPR